MAKIIAYERGQGGWSDLKCGREIDEFWSEENFYNFRFHDLP